jgi:hypothetical protein
MKKIFLCVFEFGVCALETVSSSWLFFFVFDSQIRGEQNALREFGGNAGNRLVLSAVFLLLFPIFLRGL